MRTPWFVKGYLGVGKTVNSDSSIPLVRARTVSFTTRMTFDANADTDVTVKVYYSPDGNNWDTIVFTSWTITFTASTTVQRTCILDIPEHGYLRIAIYNGSQTQTLSAISVWYTIQSWEGVEAVAGLYPYELKGKKERREETGQLVI